MKATWVFWEGSGEDLGDLERDYGRIQAFGKITGEAEMNERGGGGRRRVGIERERECVNVIVEGKEV